MPDRLISEKGVKDCEGTSSAGRLNLCEVEELARNMIRKAQEKVDGMTRKAGELEEEYRKRRAGLEEEIRTKRDALQEELSERRKTAEKELEALEKKVREKAYREGWQKGHEEGMASGLKEGKEEGRQEGLKEAKENLSGELENAVSCLRSVVKSVDASRRSLFRDAEKGVLSLALAVGEKVVKREVRSVPDAVLNNVRKALEVVAGRSSATVEVNPGDLELVKKHAEEVFGAFQESADLNVVENPDVEKGGCLVTSPTGGADLRISTQLDLIEQALLGEKGE